MGRWMNSNNCSAVTSDAKQKKHFFFNKNLFLLKIIIKKMCFYGFLLLFKI